MRLLPDTLYHDIVYNTTGTEAQQKSKFDSQKTPHTSPSRVSYGVSIVRILEKIDCVIMAPHCTWNIVAYSGMICMIRNFWSNKL